MNHIYRSIYNRALGAWQAVAETARGTGKNSLTVHQPVRHALRILLLAFFPLTPIAQALAADLPTQGSIVSGSGSISQSGNTLTVTQGSDKLITNWQSFSIGAGNTVNFVQPSSSSVALNRVLGNNASQIYGSLNANGQVFLINPNGVLFGQGAQVNVGSLVASTLNLSDADFLNGHYVFSGSGGTVSNAGTLRAADGGAIALLGGKVSNTGVIEARLGTVAMASGSQLTLDFAGDGLLKVTVDQALLNALVENHGAIRANGGSVLLTANAGEALLQTVVNITGLIEAQTVENREGRIVLLGGFEGGTVNVAGTLDASAPDSGNGGFIESSGAHVKIADSVTITTKAASGNNGTWLIDPVDFTIAASGGDMTGTALSNALANGNVTIQSTLGAGGTQGDVNVKDTVSWSQNILTLNAQNDINILAQMNASNTAGLALEYGQGAVASGNTSTYNVNAPVNLASTGSFSTKKGSDGSVVNWTIITSLGAEGSTTGTDLQGMNGNLSGNYVLGADIDASSTAGWEGGLGFAPVGGNNLGASDRIFTGNFDGLGHVINDLSINRPSYNHVGLFGETAHNVIANVGLNNAAITGRTQVGGVVGRTFYVTVHNSYVSGSVTGTVAVGGIIGTDILPRGSSRLINVYSSADVTATQAGDGTGVLSGIAGGLAGANIDLIENSYSTGNVSGGNYVGGLVGYADEATIRNSYFAGTVTVNGTPYTSGAIMGGRLNDIGNVLTNVYWNTDLTGTSLTATGNSNASKTNVAGLSTLQMSDAANWVGFTFTTTPGGDGWVLVGMDGSLNNSNGAVLPMRAEEWSPVIHNAHQLQLMALDKGASYTLANNIDASATNGKDVWLSSSFVSVGNVSSGDFTGRFDGQGHSIDGLTIARSSANHIGLFGTVSGSSLSHVSLTNLSVEGYDNVGGLVGWATGSHIQDVTVSGSVSGNDNAGGLVGYNVNTSIEQATAAVDVNASGDYAGGLVGENMGSNARISGSHATGTVVSSGHYVGGLVGSNAGNGSVSDSDATGEVRATGNFVGGLIGSNEGSINNSDAFGSVEGSNYVGGLVGNSSGSINDSEAEGEVVATGNYAGGLVGQNAGSISGAYAMGDVAGVVWVGGLVGRNQSGNISDSIASGDVTGDNSVGGLVGELTAGNISDSRSSSQVDASGNFVGGLVGTATSAATVISGSRAVGDVSGNHRVGGLVGWSVATISNSYASGLAEGMDYVGGLVGRSGTTGTISNSYATGEVNGRQWVGGLVGESNAAIGNSHAEGPVTATGSYAGGLVGAANASITDSHAIGAVSGQQRVGGLIGEAHAAISNSHAEGSVTATGDYAGGLVGATDAAITDSHADGVVQGASYVGGLTGWTSALVQDVHATGDVTGSGGYVGGLAGQASGIEEGWASGVVSGLAYVGGLAGSNSGAIRNSHASGNVTATGASGGASWAGGLVGSNTGDVSNSHASGNVDSAGDIAGGLVGSSIAGAISGVYATGSVTGAEAVGGLLGIVSGSSTLTNSFATGAVHGVNRVGGLAGQSQIAISNSYATGAVSSTAGEAGGLVGYNLNSGGALSNSYSSGMVSGSTFLAGGLVGRNDGVVSSSFWNTETSNQAASAGGTGITTAQMRQASTFTDAGWNISASGGEATVWRIYEGPTAPLLRSFLTPLTVTANSGSKSYDGTTNGLGVSYSTTPDSSLLLGSTQGTLASAAGGAQTASARSLYSSQFGYDITYVDGTVEVLGGVEVGEAQTVSPAYTGALASLPGNPPGMPRVRAPLGTQTGDVEQGTSTTTDGPDSLRLPAPIVYTIFDTVMGSGQLLPEEL